MTSLPSGVVLRRFNDALSCLEREHLRLDEDVIGLALPEPLDSRPGVVASVFPRSGNPPREILIYPARAIVRASLVGTPDLRIIHPIKSPDAAAHPLGTSRPATLTPVKEINALRNRYMQLLDTAAVAVATGERSDQALRVELRQIFDVLALPALRSSYLHFAPAFHAWLTN